MHQNISKAVEAEDNPEAKQMEATRADPADEALGQVLTRHMGALDKQLTAFLVTGPDLTLKYTHKRSVGIEQRREQHSRWVPYGSHIVTNGSGTRNGRQMIREPVEERDWAVKGLCFAYYIRLLVRMQSILHRSIDRTILLVSLWMYYMKSLSAHPQEQQRINNWIEGLLGLSRTLKRLDTTVTDPARPFWTWKRREAQ